MEANVIILVGKTGSGKGTQADLLSEKTGYKIFSTGELFRQAREKDNSLGALVKKVYEDGRLFPYWFPTYFFMDVVLNAPLEEGFIFEGTARTPEEAAMVDEILDWLGRKYVVVHLNVSDEEVIERMQGRDRGDTLNQIEKIKVRLEEYRNKTAKAIEFFRNNAHLIDVNGEQSPEAVHREIMEKLS